MSEVSESIARGLQEMHDHAQGKIAPRSRVDLRGTRWQDPVSLAALEECKQMENTPEAYKRFKNAEELFADLDSDDTESAM